MALLEQKRPPNGKTSMVFIAVGVCIQGGDLDEVKQAVTRGFVAAERVTFGALMIRPKPHSPQVGGANTWGACSLPNLFGNLPGPHYGLTRPGAFANGEVINSV
jgi:hypothetical protein